MSIDSPAGLGIAREFFLSWGVPFINNGFPALKGRFSAGLFSGSQVLGADDELSRDHGWGPVFTIVLSNDDYASHGATLEAQVSEHAPREWRGQSYVHGSPNVDVHSIDMFAGFLAGFISPPANPRELIQRDLRSRECFLYMLRHGHIFADPLSLISSLQRQYHIYPEIVWKYRVWQELYDVWYYGEYNLLGRAIPRGDTLATSIVYGRFVESVMRLLMLLSGDYTPYWKWLTHEYRKVPGSEDVVVLLGDFSEGARPHLQTKLVSDVCLAVDRLLGEHGMPDGVISANPQSTQVLYRRQEALKAVVAAEWVSDGSPSPFAA
jgi:hypothetical protein